MVLDGSVKEKCRQGFGEAAKLPPTALATATSCNCRLGPEATLFPLMHEEMDLHNPETQKEDCELNCLDRLSHRLKKESPSCPSACRRRPPRLSARRGPLPVVDWKYVLTSRKVANPPPGKRCSACFPPPGQPSPPPTPVTRPGRNPGLSLDRARDVGRTPDQRPALGRDHGPSRHLYA